jgi:zinc protease
MSTARNASLALLAAALGCGHHAPPASPAAPGMASVPVVYRTLANGLKVVLSPDTTAPIVTVAVYYHIGFRIEPRDRTGFAHLFEHLMFQGSRNLGKMQFIRLIQSNGGILNGSTRFDFTNYFEIVPANTLQTVLWAEADRMRGLAITQDNLTNQQGVVKSEVRVNVLNSPYGGFPWLQMPQYANTNWYNAHNFYGDLHDIDAATLGDAQAFFHNYYSPGNAVLVVTGAIDPAQTAAWIDQYFAPIPAAPLPSRPDVSEPPQQHEIRATLDDTLASRPALAIAYHMPPRNTPEFYAMGLIDQIMLQGHDSRLYDALVQRAALTGDVEGGINLLGNMFDYEGPMLWMAYLYHDAQVPPDRIVAAVDSAIAPLLAGPVEPSLLARALVKERAGLYATIGGTSLPGFGRADLLASFALFDNDPGRINTLDRAFQAVTPELILRTARTYLVPSNRTVLVLNAKARSAHASVAQ